MANDGTPLATYRLQLSGDFTFADAAALVDYLADLGVTHAYTSPVLQAPISSTHGYDALDPTRVSDTLGGEAGRIALAQALARRSLGWVLDVAPNHLGVAGGRNPLWWDVLEHGQASRWAGFFDIDWHSRHPKLSGRVLLPILGEHYCHVLAAGQLSVARDGGAFVVRYFDHEAPLCPESLPAIFEPAAQAAASAPLSHLAEGLAGLRGRHVGQPDARQREMLVLRRLMHQLIERPEIAAAVDSAVAEINADVSRLDELLDAQHYRLAWWRAAGSEINYRRFFDIATLVGVRVEDAEVFNVMHRRALEWVRAGQVQGLRIDHPDGLRDPGEYFRRLRQRSGDAWIVAEKILQGGEQLPRDWPVDGTTGYDFLNELGGLYVDGSNEREMTELFSTFTGQADDYPTVLRRCKLLVLDGHFGGELDALADMLAEIAAGRRQWRDCTRLELREAVRELAADYGVYRSYAGGGAAISEQDRRALAEAIQRARRARPGLDELLWELLGGVLSMELGGAVENEFVMRFQQLCAPAMAKGGEDTAFYRYNRLASLCEVGGDPARFGVTAEEFHAFCQRLQRDWPATMLASSTHDTKRSEDVRARISLLSEMPGDWGRAVGRWAERNARHRRGGMPDRGAEYLLYQSMVGAWPVSRERMRQYMLKAAREAKACTSWTDPDGPFEDALLTFVDALYGDGEFIDDLQAFCQPLIAAGRINSLSQTLIKCLAPGAADFYQGCELWDLSLVDPDNRRPVDYELRRRLLGELAGLDAAGVMRRMDEGVAKLWVIHKALAVRRRLAECFGRSGTYEPLETSGEKARHALAFVRGGRVAAVAPRLIVGLAGQWGRTSVHLPDGRWFNEFTGAVLAGEAVDVQALLGGFPVAILTRQDRQP